MIWYTVSWENSNEFHTVSYETLDRAEKEYNLRVATAEYEKMKKVKLIGIRPREKRILKQWRKGK